MLCRIADLLIEVPEAGGMAPRCGDYQTDEVLCADISICAKYYHPERYPQLTQDQVAYMHSGMQFYHHLLSFNGMMLHASAVAVEGRGYLFSGPCGMGKSTHTKLWQKMLGEEHARVFNDDKPALRRLDNGWVAYGTPWCGKDGINLNMRVPIAGICFLKRGERNEIRKLTSTEALPLVLAQTPHRFRKVETLDRMLGLVEQLVREIPIYELTNKPELDAARLSYETMRRGAKEAKL